MGKTLMGRLRALLVSAVVIGTGTVCSLRCSNDGLPAASDAGGDRIKIRDVIKPDDGQSDLDAADGAMACPPVVGNDGLVHDWPGFRRLTEFDLCCTTDIEMDSSAAKPLQWASCGSGCQQLVLEQGPTAPTLRVLLSSPDDAGGSHLYLGELVGPDAVVERHTVYDFTTGTVLARTQGLSSQGCALLPIPGEQDHVLLSGLSLSGQTKAQVFPSGAALAQGPLALTAFSFPAPPTNAAVSAARLVYDFQYNAYAIKTCTVGSPDAGAQCVSANLQSVSPAMLRLDFLHGTTVFAVSEHGTKGWGQEYVIDTLGEVTLLRANPAAHVGAMQTDGNVMVWTETYGSTNFGDAQTLQEVWTAPFTADPVTLASTAKKIATIPTPNIGGAAIFFNGYYGVYSRNGSSWSGYYIIRVSDGALVTVPQPPPPFNVHRAFYVDKQELWATVEGRIDGGTPQNSPWADAVMRLTLPTWP